MAKNQTDEMGTLRAGRIGPGKPSRTRARGVAEKLTHSAPFSNSTALPRRTLRVSNTTSLSDTKTRVAPLLTRPEPGDNFRTRLTGRVSPSDSHIGPARIIRSCRSIRELSQGRVIRS